MITLYADNHGEEFAKNLKTYQPKHPEDLLILLGDTEIRLADKPVYTDFEAWLMAQTFETAIVDGNHENYPYLDACPTETWHGGLVNRLSEHVVRLRRGELYTIEGHTFFVMGGCESGAKWKAAGLWFPGDVPSHEELAHGYQTLAKADYRVDVILTHKYYDPQTCFMEPDHEAYDLLRFNRFIDARVQFKKWYSGHRHVIETWDEKHEFIFDQLKEMEF